MSFIYSHTVVFGDCDPAGIVYYPLMFSWMDAAFHRRLAAHGGHATICESLKSKGLGLVSASAQFRQPLGDGDRVDIHIDRLIWSDRSLTLEYAGRIGDTLHFTGTEVRCMFVTDGSGISAAEIAPLKAILE